MIVVMCIIIIRLSDNSKSVYDSNDVHVSKRITVENLAKRINERHRARRLPGDLRMIIDECGYHLSKTTLFIN
jgi:hypothetical protein